MVKYLTPFLYFLVFSFGEQGLYRTQNSGATNAYARFIIVCFLKQATPPLFLERFGLIIKISLFKTESLSFVSLAPITEVFVNC